ncbi:hypothetical protein LCGC14_1622840 [marine sediment metagenome]|uniref:Uncharacterized protein n=1 Tax=marine sediment metagenome TaxID=412755 RepID=A0A0F9I4X4_9ZZZZ
MTSLSSTELSRMRDDAEKTMYDLCFIGKYMRDEADGFNLPEDYWQDVSNEVSCGFKTVRNREAMGETEVVMIEAELRLPYDTDIDRRDRVRITYRLGEFIKHEDQPVFRIVGQPVHGHAAIVLQLIKDTEV